MLRIIVFIFSSIFMSNLFAAGQADDTSIVIGVPMATFNDKWLSYVHEAMEQFDEEHDDAKLLFTDANRDPKKQLDDVDNFIAQNVNAILTVPLTLEQIPLMGSKAKKAGIPVVIVNVLGDEEGMKDITSYIGSPEYEAGKIQAQEVLNFMGEEGEVAILMGNLGQTAQMERTRGVVETLAPYPGIKVVAQQTANWDRFQGRSVTQDWLQAYPHLKAIVANNDEMAIGALLAARSAGLKDEDLAIIGVDATPDALEFLGQGLDATVLQDAQKQGYIGAETAYKAAKGEPVEARIWIPFVPVTE